MRIALAAIEFDILGYIEIDVLPDNEPAEKIRRATRSPVLGGGAVLSDGGYTDADRTFNYTWQPVSQSHNDSVARLLETYSLIKVHNREGTFSCSFTNFRDDGDISSIRLLPIEKLS